MGIRVSVVIPTCKRPDLLVRVLEALRLQDYDPAGFEILVVDDGVDEGTRQVVEQQRRVSPVGPHIRYLPVPERRGPAAARNLGWRSARGEIIAFTDDDTLPTHTWLTNGLAHFNRGADGVSGRVIVPLGESPTDYELNAAGLEYSRFVTANCLYRRDILEAVDGFDESFHLAWREDSDLYFRLQDCGFSLVDGRDAVVIHPIRPAPWGVSVQQQRKSMYNALLYKKHPRLYRQLQPSPPWLYYAILGCLGSALVSLAARQPALALAFGFAWVALTLLFAARRLRGTSHSPTHIAEMIYTSALIPPLSVFWRLRGAMKYKVFFL